MPNTPEKAKMLVYLDDSAKEAFKRACGSMGLSMSESVRRLILLASARPDLLVVGLDEQERERAQGMHRPASSAFARLRRLYHTLDEPDAADGDFEHWVGYHTDDRREVHVDLLELADVVRLVDEIVERKEHYGGRADFIRWAVRMLVWLEVRDKMPKMPQAERIIGTSVLLARAQHIRDLTSIRDRAAEHVEKVADDLDEMDQMGLAEARTVVEKLLAMVPGESVQWMKMQDALKTIKGKEIAGGKRRKWLELERGRGSGRVTEEWPENRKFDHSTGQWVLVQEDGSHVPVDKNHDKHAHLELDNSVDTNLFGM